MLGLLRQPLLKSVKIAQFGVKNVAQPIPRVLQKSYGSCRKCGYYDPLNQPKGDREFDGVSVGISLATIGLVFFYSYHFIKNVLASPENKIPVQQRVDDCLFNFSRGKTKKPTEFEI